MNQTPPPLQTESTKAEGEQNSFGCEQCGANLKFTTGTDTLTCPFCGHQHVIEQSSEVVEELDYHAYLLKQEQKAVTQEFIGYQCDSCGAQSQLAANEVAGLCDFCAAPVVVSKKNVRQIKPLSLLPFQIKQKEAFEAFKNWIGKLWFAPSLLKRLTRLENKLNGVYLPFWTFDSNTYSHYSGQRGTYYYVTESYTATVDGKSVRKTREVRHTRWRPVSGSVSRFFNDVIVPANKSLNQKKLEALEPWDLQNLKPYQDDYLSGFKAQRYQVGLASGFDHAKVQMQKKIRQLVKNDINGDEQRIISINSQFNDLRFKHILLPVWISSFRYKNKSYQILVNARTGEVQGERPWSWIKISSAIIGLLALIGLGIVIWLAATDPNSAPALWWSQIKNMF